MASSNRESALVLLIQSIFDQLDELAALKSKGYSGDLSYFLLREMASILPGMDEESKDLYFNFLISIGTEREVPRSTATNNQEYIELTTQRKKNFIANIKTRLASGA